MNDNEANAAGTGSDSSISMEEFSLVKAELFFNDIGMKNVSPTMMQQFINANSDVSFGFLNKSDLMTIVRVLIGLSREQDRRMQIFAEDAQKKIDLALKRSAEAAKEHPSDDEHAPMGEEETLNDEDTVAPPQAIDPLEIVDLTLDDESQEATAEPSAE